MTSRTAKRLVCLYPRRWRARYGDEFAALLEQHPFSFKTLANVLWSAGEARMRTGISHERNQGAVVGSIWTAWVAAVVAGLILYGMIDDSPLLAAMDQSSIFAASWKVIQIGCMLAVSAIVIAGLPLASSMALYAIRGRRRDVGLQLSVPLIAACALVAWIAAVLIATGGHWAASPWAVAFPRPDWPSGAVRWTSGAISSILLILGCVASAASVSQLLRDHQLPDFRITFPGVRLQVKPLSFAASLMPCVVAGIFVMLAGVVAWGSIAMRLSALTFQSCNGPLGLTGLASWLLCVIILGFSAVISGHAAWRGRMLSADS